MRASRKSCPTFASQVFVGSAACIEGCGEPRWSILSGAIGSSMISCTARSSGSSVRLVARFRIRSALAAVEWRSSPVCVCPVIMVTFPSCPGEAGEQCAAVLGHCPLSPRRRWSVLAYLLSPRKLCDSFQLRFFPLFSYFFLQPQPSARTPRRPRLHVNPSSASAILPPKLPLKPASLLYPDPKLAEEHLRTLTQAPHMAGHA